MGYKLKRILIYPDGVTEKQVYPVWKPGVNTIAYYPLTSTTTANDKSGNGYNLTNYNSVQFGEYHGVNCANFSGNNMILYRDSTPTLSSNFTISAWVYINSTTSSEQCIVLFGNRSQSSNLCMGVTNGYISGTSVAVSSGTWHNVIFARSGSSLDLIVDTNKLTVSNSSSAGGIYIGRYNSNSGSLVGNISEVIYENRYWSAEEVANYYNTTKSKYGS